MKVMTLGQHAARRLRLAGHSILEEGNPWFASLDTLQSVTEEKGAALVSFANYDYLGLSGHPSTKRAAAAALERWGVGALGSRLVGGERSCHAAFEEALAAFVGAEDCLSLVSGYLTNLSIISHLMGARDLVIVDELCHNSIISGSKSSKASIVTFRHNDIDHLEYVLRQERDSARNCLLVVEGLYSMDGDLPDLPALLKLKETYNCWLLVDEAHSFGTLGRTGRGISEHYGEDPTRIDLIVGTLSKSLASCGGFVCASRDIIQWLRFTLPGFVYSVGLSPIIIAAAHAGLDLMVQQPDRIEKLRIVSELFANSARAAGLDVGGAVGRAIVPVLFEDLSSTMAASRALLAANIYAPPIVHVGVPKDAPRIRFFLSATHEPHHVEEAIGVLQNYQGHRRTQLLDATA